MRASYSLTGSTLWYVILCSRSVNFPLDIFKNTWRLGNIDVYDVFSLFLKGLLIFKTNKDMIDSYINFSTENQYFNQKGLLLMIMKQADFPS